MYKKADRILETKEGETMSQSGHKNLPSHYHIKKPLIMLMYALVPPKNWKKTTNTDKLTESVTSASQEAGRWGFQSARRLSIIIKNGAARLDPWEIFILPKISLELYSVEKIKAHPNKKNSILKLHHKKTL